jgi:hypothetical protein
MGLSATLSKLACFDEDVLADRPDDTSHHQQELGSIMPPSCSPISPSRCLNASPSALRTWLERRQESRTPSHLPSGKFRWPLDKFGQILRDPVRGSAVRFLCPSLILKDADRRDDIVACIDAIIGDKSWDLAHERDEPLLGTSCQFIQ